MSCRGDMSRFWSTYVEICRKMSISERFLSIYVDLCRFLSIIVDIRRFVASIYVDLCRDLSMSVEVADGGGGTLIFLKPNNSREGIVFQIMK